MSSILIGEKVKSLRIMSGLGQEQIAQFLGVDQSTISKCEKGERQFQVAHLERLGSLFGIPLADMMKEEMPMSSIQIAFRTDAIQMEDLNAIAEIQKIAVNLCQMRIFLQESLNER